jgi:hypothetical protein
MAHTFPHFAPQLALKGALPAVEVDPKFLKRKLPASEPAQPL